MIVIENGGSKDICRILLWPRTPSLLHVRYVNTNSWQKDDKTHYVTLGGSLTTYIITDLSTSNILKKTAALKFE